MQPLLYLGCEPPRYLIRRQKNVEHFISSVSKVIRNQLSLRAVRQDNRVPLRNTNFPSGHNSKQTEGKEKSVLEMSKIFLASVLQNLSVLLRIKQSVSSVCRQEISTVSTCSPPALASGHFHYSSMKIFFL